MLGLSKASTSQRGDTLIEVLFAVTVFAFIIISAFSLMNQGLNTAQRSLEITLARQSMDSQADTLRFLQESYVDAYKSGTITYKLGSPAAEYQKIIQFAQAGGGAPASKFGDSDTCVVPPNPGRSFILDPVNAKIITTAIKSNIFQTPDTYAQLTFSPTTSALDLSKGIWIEAVHTVSSPSSGYIDFHIRACWDAPGVALPTNLGTIVRLYEPRG